MVRFIHTADWQLGMTRSFLDPREALSRFRQDRIDAVRRIGEVASAEDAEFVVVAGDVFETNQVDPLTIERACEALGAIPVPVYLLPGNHDPLDGASVFRSARFLDAVPDHVVVLDDATPRRVPGVAAEVVGAPYRTRHPLEDLAAAAVADLSPTGGALVRVLVAHGAADEAVAFDDSKAAPIRTAELLAAVDDGRIQYAALGDRHSTTDVGNHGTVWYSGAPEPTRFTEVDAGNVLVVDLEPGQAPQVRRVPVGSWRFERLDVELSDVASVDRLDAQLGAYADPATVIVRLGLHGVISLSARARLEAVLDRHGHRMGCLETPDRHDHLVTEPTEDDLDALALEGYARSAFEELRTSNDPSAKDALAELFRLTQEVTR